ncbi:hypothetical protein [Spiroplasma sp. AdecLV25b]|uniref:hypothetical protein n=1 Tax=Spiroplasma sp. AdecLV25b TaxID=3027162 RepID=UPI0027E001B1|nr:hypothetical protein [Spiroplasma sp. AdecLV25b]
MKRSKKNKDEDIWKEINGLTKHVIEKKLSSSQIRKRWFISAIAILCTLILGASTFLIGFAMQSAFNMGDFEHKMPEESIVVDMNKVDIHASDKSLRLPYFEEETIDQVFKLMTNDSWWQGVLPTEKDKYDFTFYSQNGVEGIDSSLVQADGLVHCSLKVKLRNLPIEFKLPVISQIINTAKFYEKFMRFNQFDGHYSKHISGNTPNPLPWPVDLQEKRYQGYLPGTMYFDANVSNVDIYNSIQQWINKFIADYAEEFAPNTHLFPILSTNDLGDVDLNDPLTFTPYLQMIARPDLFYIGNAVAGAPNQYVNLQNYTFIPWDPPKSPRSFYISYVSNPDIINHLIDLKLTTKEQLIDYFTRNPIDYIPFSHVQKGEDATIAYTPSHLISSMYNPAGVPLFQYWELVHYFANDHSISNDVKTIRAADYANIGVLTTALENQYWQNMFDWLLAHKAYFNLHYPNLATPGEPNWQTITAGGITTFKQYFATALNVVLPALTTFTFLDNNHSDIALLPNDLINPDEITNFRFDIGQDLVSNPNYNTLPDSFNFFFKINWI